jgi:hypothetical protein
MSARLEPVKWAEGLPRLDELPSFGRQLERTFVELESFVRTPAFQSLVMELQKLPPSARASFTRKVVLDPAELEKRGVYLPRGMIIQCSRFGDRRPNLFCVKKFVRPGLNLNITFSPKVRGRKRERPKQKPNEDA